MRVHTTLINIAKISQANMKERERHSPIFDGTRPDVKGAVQGIFIV